MMYDAIKNFAKQFEYEPQIINADALGKADKFIVVGMGGSHLAADFLKMIKPQLDLIIHRNYDLPNLPQTELKNYLVILSSYSGNTEEVLDAFEKVRGRKLNYAVIAVGGKLLDMAKENNIPYIQLPDTGIQPRCALGFSLRAFLKLIGENNLLNQTKFLVDSLKPLDYEEAGKKLAQRLKGYVPIIYCSENNAPIAYNWKIKFNETGKIPAFYNVLPELNHNEMTGFSAGGGSQPKADQLLAGAESFGGDVHFEVKSLLQNFYFILLKDRNDHPRNIKRMDILEKLYRDRNLMVESIELEEMNFNYLGELVEQGDESKKLAVPYDSSDSDARQRSRELDIFYKIFSSLILADWTAYYIAEGYGLESEQVPMVEEFKKLME